MTESFPNSGDNRTARFWEPDGTDIQCRLCPHQCRIAPGHFGRCRVRRNDSGQLVLPYGGRFTSLAADPIEKKPLYHFYPNTPILSIGSLGCNLTCRFCQNASISQPNDSLLAASVPSLIEVAPKTLVETAQTRSIPAIAFTYNEPAVFAEYVIEASRLARKNGIRTVAVTNGMITGAARREFFGSLDGANIDLKSFSPAFYREICGGDLSAVKETIRYVRRETQVWLELTTLLIPGLNDSTEEIRALCGWVAENIGTETPLHFSAFFPTYRMTDRRRTDREILVRACEIGRSCGLRYLYRGNIDDSEGQTTRCPHCRRVIVERNGYRVKVLAKDGICPNCGRKTEGRWN